MKIIKISILALLSLTGYAQGDERANYQPAKKYSYNTYLNFMNGVSATTIGPTIMSGRVVDLDVDPADPTHFYVAFATGGLWETTNNGTSFEHIFKNEISFGIGDIAVNWKTKRIYVGTGENNSSRSSYAGLGILYSDDNGKTWNKSGLEATHHIGRIVVNPNNDDVFVAAIGHLFTYNKERGVYKSSDGGKTWKQTLFINEKTGVIDLVQDPSNPQNLYAAAWQRERVGWNFEESGEGSGIYKSTDGGETWTLVSTMTSGFPTGKGVGRIGLAVSYQDSKVVYAFLDNQDHRLTSPGNRTEGLTKEDFRKITKEEFVKLNPEKIEKYLRANEFPEKYTGESVMAMVKADKIKPVALVEYLEDANSMLFDTPVKGAELYRSNDGGKTWNKTHEGYLDNMVFTYGYYFGQVRVHPKNHDKVYLAAFYVATSNDGGKNFKNINGDNVHVDHHGLWIDPTQEGHLINGNDGGVNITYDDGKNWTKCINTSTGQFYTVAVDNEEVYNVYGGLQDNGVWYGPHTYRQSDSWQMEGKYPYQTILGGDGMQVQVDTRDNNTIYTGWQFGNYFRVNRTTNEMKYITPKHELGERPLRFNWQSPIHLSVHQRDVLYIGANKVFRSFDKGDNFVAISEDLTTGGKKGDVAFCTVTALHESPRRFGLLYAGTDDGLVHVTKDGGATWENISAGLPAGYWVRRIVASAHQEGKVFVCLSGHTMDDFRPLLFVSNDYGKNWKLMVEGLSYYPVNVIREDETNPQLLYLGTDNGLYISIDGGIEFFPVKNNFPLVPVHDLAIQSRDADLVIATHGKSLFRLDLEALRKITAGDLEKKFALLPIDKIKEGNWGRKAKWYEEERKEKTIALNYFNQLTEAENILITIKDNDGDVLYSESIKAEKGLQAFRYNLTIQENLARSIDAIRKKKNMPTKFKEAANGKFYLTKGKYRVNFQLQGKNYEQMMEIIENK